VVLLGACSHSNPPPPGTPVLTMSDLTNSGDFVSYIVNIDSIQLTRNDGTVVAVLATPQTVDFARLNTRTELVAAPAVPDGTYTAALITLDWTATPSVYLNNGGQTLAAAPQNVSGAAMAAVGVPVTFDPSHPLVIPQNRSVRLHVAVDLTASNALTATSPSAVVQVQPFVVITPAPVDATVMRLRGLFVTTQTLTSGFYMNARPFYDLVSAYGSVIVNTNAQTYFNINGVTYTGAAGLTALAPLQENVPLAVYGTLDNLSGITPTFNATEVYVGTGQESQLAYYLTGTVTARSGDTLTVRAADYLTPLGVTGYIDSISVTLGGSTAVFEDGIATPGLTSASVSVGQQITVAGQPPPNATSLGSLDASSGLVRLHPTTLWGMLNADATLDVLSLGGFGQAQLNFAGTGTTGHDATPAAYVVDTSAVPAGPATNTGELLQVQGKVAPFGAAPPDFIARTVTPGPNTLQTLVVAWANGGSTHPFTSISSSGLVVNLADANLGAGATHEIRTGPAALDLKTLTASPVITTAGADQTNLQLAVGSTALSTGISVFNSAAGFANAVSSAFNGTNKVFRLVAYGQYDPASNTFVAARINVALHE
jgi:hypothetical protein